MNDAMIRDYLHRYPCEVRPNGNIMTCPVRLSFPELFEAKARTINGVTSEPKYEVALLFPKGANLRVLVDEATRVANDAVGQKWKIKLPNGKIIGHVGSKDAKLVSFPLRDGEEMTQYGGFEEGAYFMKVRSKTRPGIVDRQGRPITDERAMYPGVWALVTVRAFWYDVDMKKGVSFGLQNIQKFADDDPLGSTRSSAEDEFEPLDEEDADEHADSCDLL